MTCVCTLQYIRIYLYTLCTWCLYINYGKADNPLFLYENNKPHSKHASLKVLYQAKLHNFITVFQYLGLTASASWDDGSRFINTASLICFIFTNSLFSFNASGK